MVTIVQDRKNDHRDHFVLVFVTAVVAVTVKVYEWWQDVLYGPYIRRADRRRIR